MADCSGAFQNACNDIRSSASGLGVLLVEPGTYSFANPFKPYSGTAVWSEAGPLLTTFKMTAGFPSAAHTGIIYFDGAQSAIFQGNIVRGIGFDTTLANSGTNVCNGIFQIDAPSANASAMQRCLFEDLYGVLNVGGCLILLQGLGQHPSQPSFGLNFRRIWTVDGGGTVDLYSNVTGTNSGQVYDITVEDIKAEIKTNGVADDRVAISANAPGATSAKGLTRDLDIRSVHVHVQSAVTSATVNGVKLDCGNWGQIRNIQIEDVHLYNEGSGIISGAPVFMALGTNGGLQDWTVDGVYGYRANAVQLRGWRWAASPYFIARNIRQEQCQDANRAVELYVAHSAAGDELVDFENIVCDTTVTQGTNNPVGLMLASGGSGQGCSGVVRIAGGEFSGFKTSISNNLNESAATSATGFTNLQIKEVAGLSRANLNLINSYTLRDCPGLNPEGAAAITVGASPFTYTNNDGVLEMVYILGGTVSSVTRNAIQVFNASNCSLLLAPGESLVVTYSSAPVMNKDRK